MKQPEFAKALLDPDQPVPAGVTDPQGRPAGKRFDVYRNNVVHSLTEALGAGYPVVQKLVGDKFFTAMSGVYVRAHPPTSPMMFAFGQHFPEFLTGFPPVATLPYLPDIARLERARRQAYHAADADPIDGAVLSVLSPEQMADARLTLHPSMHVVTSTYPILSIWRKNSGEDDLEIPTTGQDVLIARPDAHLAMRALPAGAATFLTLLQSGETLAAAATACAEIPGFDLTENIGGILSARILIKTTIKGA